MPLLSLVCVCLIISIVLTIEFYVAGKDDTMSTAFLSSVVQLLSLPTQEYLVIALELIKVIIGKGTHVCMCMTLHFRNFMIIENEELSLRFVRVGIFTQLLVLVEKHEVHQQVADLIVLLLQNGMR